MADCGDELIGYAVCSLEFSTWQAAEYHLDCLFVGEPHCEEGWGRMPLDAVKSTAAALGVTQLQWQTPDWNVDAIRFYNHAGAQSRSKVRFLLTLKPTDAPK